MPNLCHDRPLLKEPLGPGVHVGNRLLVRGSDDKYNFFANLEVGKKDAIQNSARAGRGAIGRGDLRDLGYDALNSGLGKF